MFGINILTRLKLLDLVTNIFNIFLGVTDYNIHFIYCKKKHSYQLKYK